MPSETQTILNLVASIERAKKTGLTDGEAARKKCWFELFDKLKTACSDVHASTEGELLAGEKLKTDDILNILATISGFYIGAYSNDLTSELINMIQFSKNLSDSIHTMRLVKGQDK